MSRWISLMVRSLFGQFLWHWILTVGVPIGLQSLVWSLAVGLALRRLLLLLPTTHVFQPVAIETLGPLDPSRAISSTRLAAECRPSLETGGKRRFSFSACQWPSKDSILSLSLALS